jgi:FkbM family methyltransferase
MSENARGDCRSSTSRCASIGGMASRHWAALVAGRVLLAAVVARGRELRTRQDMLAQLGACNSCHRDGTCSATGCPYRLVRAPASARRGCSPRGAHLGVWAAWHRISAHSSTLAAGFSGVWWRPGVTAPPLPVRALFPHAEVILKAALLIVEASTVDRHEGDVFVDAGASTRLVSMVASRCVGASGKVLAFEPLPLRLRHLTEGLRLNKVNNVRPFPRGTSIKNDLDPARLSSETADRVSPSMVEQPGSSTADTCRVERLSHVLADEGIGRVRMIKVDVGGFELEVLRGSEPPILCVEYGVFGPGSEALLPNHSSSCRASRVRSTSVGSTRGSRTHSAALPARKCRPLPSRSACRKPSPSRAHPSEPCRQGNLDRARRDLLAGSPSRAVAPPPPSLAGKQHWPRLVLSSLAGKPRETPAPRIFLPGKEKSSTYGQSSLPARN